MRALDLLPFLLMFGVLWLLVIRPQNQEKAAHDKLLASLAKDDQIVTASGLHAKVVAVRDTTVVLEVGKGVHLTVDKSSVARRITAEAAT